MWNHDHVMAVQNAPRAEVVVDLEAIRHNVALLAERAATSGAASVFAWLDVPGADIAAAVDAGIDLSVSVRTNCARCSTPGRPTCISRSTLG